MKPREPLADETAHSMVNQNVTLARALIVEIRSKLEKAHQLTHTQKNLLTVQSFLLEQINSRRAAHFAASSPAVPKIQKSRDLTILKR